MNSLILRTAAPFLVGLTVLFSIYVLLRGHNEPGGGFIDGLIGASAFATYIISEGASATRRALIVHPMVIAGAGLFLSGLSGVVPLLFGDAFLTGQWWFPDFNPDLKYFSTVVLFDIGVSQRIPPEELERFSAPIRQSLGRHGVGRRAAEQLAAAVQGGADLLAKYLPRASDDVDELPNMA